MNRRRAGFTLVELLVVAGLMAVLFALVLAGGPAGGQMATARRAAQEFASMLLAAQSRALGKPEGAAVIVEAAADAPRLGTVIHEAVGLPPVVVTVTSGSLAANTQLSQAYKARFRMPAGTGFATISPWLKLQNQQPVRRLSAGQTAANTLIVPPAAEEAVVARYPVMGPRPVKLATTVAIDLRHSGVGDDPAALHGHGEFEEGGPVALVFDQTGRVAEVIQQVGMAGGPPVEPVVPSEPIYFLFADRQAITAEEALASNASFWVAVNPQTGRINVSSNEPAAGLTAARAKARQGIAIGK